MRALRTPVGLFLLAAGIPFLVCFTFFVVSQRRALLTEPEAYIAQLKRDGHAPYMIFLSTWKHFLVRDAMCREAATVVIGSSRVREIDANLTGTSTCNVYVDGLAAQGFARVASELPPAPAGDARVVYVGIDHFWLWIDRDPLSRVEIRLLDTSRGLWRMWAALRPLRYFTIADLLEAIRRVRQTDRRFEDYNNVWYADGHLFHPRYYALKRAGQHRAVDRRAAEESATELFGDVRVHDANVRALESGLRALHDKGYAVRAFWNPVSPAHIASARRRFPRLFDESIVMVDRLARDLPLQRYVPAMETLDPTRFGCTDRDYADATHADLDCLHRLFATIFPDTVRSTAMGRPDRVARALRLTAVNAGPRPGTPLPK